MKHGRREDTSQVSAWHVVRSALLGVIVTAGIAIALLIGVIPRVLDGAALTVLTGSMEPTYHPGDMVISAPKDRYAVGDVVTFQPVSNDPTLITHRIVAVRTTADGNEYVTRGDANTADDKPIVADQVMGSVRYHVPKVGYLSMALGQHKQTIITAAGVLLLGYGVASIISTKLTKKRKQQGLQRDQNDEHAGHEPASEPQLTEG